MKLPTETTEMNDLRALWASQALSEFERETRCDREAGESISDLICDLAHYADRNDLSLTALLARAERHYLEETEGLGQQLRR